MDLQKAISFYRKRINITVIELTLIFQFKMKKEKKNQRREISFDTISFLWTFANSKVTLSKSFTKLIEYPLPPLHYRTNYKSFRSYFFPIKPLLATSYNPSGEVKRKNFSSFYFANGIIPSSKCFYFHFFFHHHATSTRF